MKQLIIFLFPMMITGNVMAEKPTDKFNYSVDRFADIQILRFKVPGFEALPLKQKELIYYLNEAALEGRDILYDQNHRNNLTIRRTLESLYINFKGDRNTDDFNYLTTYLKQVWMGNGIHHHYAEDKFIPLFSELFFKNSILALDSKDLPLLKNETKSDFIQRISPIIFDKKLYPKKTNQEADKDLILTSANNYYEGVSQKEAEDFYATLTDPKDETPVAYGLNSKLIKENGILKEKTYKIGGMYSNALKRIAGWLKKASEVAENEQQKAVILKLISFYETGKLEEYDEYAILWLKDVNSTVDFVNGFTESYGDPLGMKASWESLVNFKNYEATKRTELISGNAQWFENHSPVDKRFKKEEVKGVTAKVITAAIIAGDCYPSTPLGVNLPNSNWIRKEHGSKSVTIENIADAYDQAASGNGFMEEFMWSIEEIDRAKKYGSLTNNLHTDLHECLGHGSGKLLPGVSSEALKAYSSPIEEARADLFGLYYIADDKMVELGLLPDNKAYKTSYYQYMMNGLMTQLTRIQPGKQIEQAHMRNRQLIAAWVFDHGKSENVVELKQKDGKTYIVINDYSKLRILFGELLKEIQRIKSTGDFEAGKNLIEKYAIQVDQSIHQEVLARYKKLDIAPYKGFVNPVYQLIKGKKGNIEDVIICYDEDFVHQNLRYSKDYSVLPNYN